jgi:putative Mn2+ efflux pump MntP
MSLTELILIAFGLSMDCFAVSLSFGAARSMSWKDIIRMAFFFGFFQGIMPLAGWLIGNSLQSYIAALDHWIAFGILAAIGLKMIIHAVRNQPGSGSDDIRKLTVLVSLSIATSIDALITGIGFGFIRVNILEAAILISVITFLVSVTGAKLAEMSRFIPARWAELFGGLVLIIIGTRILFVHLGLI